MTLFERQACCSLTRGGRCDGLLTHNPYTIRRDMTDVGAKDRSWSPMDFY